MARAVDYPVILVVTTKAHPEVYDDISFWTTVDAARARKKHLETVDKDSFNTIEIYTRI